jgi:F420-non-reducing hydrogenase large subunit
VTIPRAAELQRIALCMGSIIHSHGVHFFALAGPDLLLGLDADPAKRNIVGLMQTHPEVAQKALRLRTLGAKITEIIGGRGTHPVALVAGGCSQVLTQEKREALQKFAAEALETGKFLVDVAKKALEPQQELVQSLPIDMYHDMGTVTDDGALDLYQGKLRLRSPDGKSTLDFSEDEWADYIYEETVPSSYAKFAYCRVGDKSVAYRVGPLSRLNVCDKISTPLAQAELEAFRAAGGFPCHHTVMYHHARLVEMVYAIEKLHEVLADDEITSDHVLNKPTQLPQSATAHIEAQRGVLIHDYKVDEDGIVKRANLIVATQQNLSAINATISMQAAKLLDAPEPVLLNGIEFGIR